MPLEAGRLRERVTIERPEERPAGLGETVLEWKPVRTVWAEVQSISAQETMQAMQSQLQVTHRVTIRFVPGLLSTMRLIWRGKTLEIMSVLDRENRAIHDLICRETGL